MKELIELKIKEEPMMTTTSSGTGNSSSDCMSFELFSKVSSWPGGYVCEYGWVPGDAEVNPGGDPNIGKCYSEETGEYEDCPEGDPNLGMCYDYDRGEFVDCSDLDYIEQCYDEEYGYYDCETGPTGPDDGDPPSGGGNTPGTPSGGARPSVMFRMLANNISLDSDGIEKMNEAIENASRYCGFQAMFNYLVENGYKLDTIYIDSEMEDGYAGYSSRTNVMVFKDNSNILESFLEEFIHFFQNKYYPEGINKYAGKKGFSNIEFEAKLIINILYRIHGVASMTYGDGNQYGYIYEEWILGITKEYTYFPNFLDLLEQDPKWGNLNYWHFIDDFVNSNPYYSYPIDDTLPPRALNFLNQSGCYE